VASTRRVALVYGASVGLGGLGTQIASAIQGLAIEGVELHAFGPGRIARWPLANPAPNIYWHQAPPGIARWRAEFTWLRWWTGQLVLENSRRIGRWAAGEIQQLAPDCCYVFTHVGLETLRWARSARMPTVLESPNGHIRNFRRVNEAEARSCGARFRGHPNRAMVERVEEEYRLADRIRVSSQWSRRSLISDGLIDKEIAVFEQPINLERYRAADAASSSSDGPMRVCFVGSLDLRKGFVYLLRAAKHFEADDLALQIVGATGDRTSRRMFERESIGLAIRCAPGDPLPAYRQSELFVLPSLEDGSPFAAAEAMACGLPAIVTECGGAAEWVRPGESGWVVKGGDSAELAAALRRARERRGELRAMGKIARQDTERRAGPHCQAPFREWIFHGFEAP